MLKSQYTDDLIEAGLDEVGRGCLAGPVVAAAVIFPKGFQHELLNDSKKLTKKNREQLVSVIKANALAWSVQEVSERVIEDINILNASFLAMHHCIDDISIKPELLLVDGNRFTPYLGIPEVCIVKGDGEYLSIAAASILAKTYRDELMEQYALEYPYYGWEKNAGYPTKKHRDGIREHGVTDLHRKTFKLLPE